MVLLGRLALAGIGALAVLEIGEATGSVLAGVVAGPLVGALAGAVVALPAARDRGLQLAVVSLAFAVAVQNGVLASDWALGEFLRTDHLQLGPLEAAVPGQALAFAAAALGVGLAAAWRLARPPSLGSQHASGLTFQTRLGPGRHAGGAAFRRLVFDGGCTCFQYAGGLKPFE